MCGGKIFKPIWVGLSVGKVRSVCVKLQRNCLPFFGRLLVVGSVVLRLLVTSLHSRWRGVRTAKHPVNWLYFSRSVQPIYTKFSYFYKPSNPASSPAFGYAMLWAYPLCRSISLKTAKQKVLLRIERCCMIFRDTSNFFKANF